MGSPLPLAVATALLLALAGDAPGFGQQKQHTLAHAPGKSITLSLPAAFDIDIAAKGLRRVRFFAQSSDGRIFATGMHDLSDNRLGAVFILDEWNVQTGAFGRVTHYLDHLRNPNSIAFWTDPATRQTWLYVALTDKLVRYEYRAGDLHPSAPPQTLISFPDYGLNYKYGGWHLTRTLAVGEVQGAPRIFIAVGSSCNYCQEREAARASILSINPDGSDAKIIAQGIRNAVGLRWVPEIDGGSLFATNMGDDHLGDKLPDDTFFKIDTGAKQPLNYGWPACYFSSGTPVQDTTPLPSMNDAAMKAHTDVPAGRSQDSVYGKQSGVAEAGTNLAAGGGHAGAADPNAALGQPPAPLASCQAVPQPYAWFPAHSSPLGLERFSNSDANLKDSFLVALHGASHPSIGAGYRVVRITEPDRKPEDFITGFLTFKDGKPIVHGRPCGLFRIGPDSFLLTDDYLGLVYYIHPHA
jgi:glucose/arabinose dehydrogenase